FTASLPAPIQFKPIISGCGSFFTVMVTDAVDIQPLFAVVLTVYFVVTDGVAVTTAVFVPFNPAAGCEL
ncbi:hypothetical protein ACEV76_24920, partial [Vibrio parahaemolyticus]